MKKFLVLICFIFLFVPQASAKCDYKSLCAPKTYSLSPKIAQKISRKTGATTIAEKIAQARIKSELRKSTKQNLDVTIKSFGLLDLLYGKFKSITISGKNLDIQGVYLSSLVLKSICDFNYVQFNKNPIRFKENMVVSFAAIITEDDLKKTMQSSGYLNRLNCVNVHGCGITFFKLSGAGVSIKDNKLQFKVRITSQLLLEKPLDVSLSTNLNAKNGRLVLTKIDLKNVVKGVDLSRVANQLNTINPLTFSLIVFENKNSKLCLNDVKISGNKILLNGNLFIPKSQN